MAQKASMEIKAGIAIIGDVHANHGRLDAGLALLKGLAVDLAVLTGDVGLDPPWIAPRRRRGEHDASVRSALGLVGRELDCPVVFVPGNHDLRDPQAIPGATNIDGVRTQIAGLRVAGLGGAGPARFGFPYEWSEEQAELALETTFDGAVEPTDIFLSHTPPAETALDRTLHGKHVGSEAVRRRIETVQPRLFVCGHIHESWGLARVHGVPCINAGALGPPAAQDIVWHVLWDGGPARAEVRRRDSAGKETTRSWDLRD